MLTSLELAKLLRDQKRKTKNEKSGFDGALCGLGITQRLKLEKHGSTQN
jgi:hypothetical protein